MCLSVGVCVNECGHMHVCVIKYLVCACVNVYMYMSALHE